MLTSKALLDTGSPRSFMSVSILSQLSSNIEFILTPLSAIDSHYQNPDGTSLDIIGRARIPIQLNNLSDIIAADFLVSRTLKTSIILGRDFLELAGISLYMDYQKPEIYRKYKQSVNHFKDPVKTLTMVDGHLVGSVTEYRDCTDMCDGARKSKDVADIEVYEEPETDDNIVKIENDLSQVKDDRIRKMLMEFSSITTSELSSTPCAVTEHHIELIDGAKPYKRAYYRVNPKERQFIDEQIVKLLELGIIAPSRSSWGSPIVLVKKHDGSFRMCIDFRKLNEATKPELQPLPFFEDTFDRMSGMKIFTTLDLKSGYWQVALDKESRQLTAFICHRGLYEWRRMPMGLRNATATFQRLMKQVLAGLEHFTEVHVDDIIIFSKNYEEHLQHVHSVLERLADAHLILNLPKCHFAQSELKFIGHIFSDKGIRPNPEKIEAMLKLESPDDATKARSFLGAANYYRRFISHYSEIARPIIEVCKPSVVFRWGQRQQEAFDQLKTELSKQPILVHPNFDMPFKVTCDASDYAISGMLSQSYDNIDHPVAYYSRTLSGPQLNYYILEKECLAIVESIKNWRHYLNYSPFVVETDHAPLKWLRSLQEPTRRQTRWSIYLQEYEFTVVHKPGKLNVVADALSRCHAIAEAAPTPEISFEDDLVEYVTHHKHLDGVSLLQRKRIERKAMEIEVTDGKLYHKKRLIPDKSNRKDIIERCHLLGHFGVSSTSTRVLEEYWWPSLYEDVKKVIADCRLCAAYNDDTGPKMVPRALRTHHPQGAFHLLSMDLFGPLPLTSRGNCYVIVFIDYLTKWVEAFAIPNKEEGTIAKYLLNEIICRYGPPVEILSDQGKEFINRVVSKLEQMSDVIVRTTSGYHPETNGLTEKTNHIYAQMLRKFCDGDRKNWDLWLPYICLCDRSRMHKSTGHSPMYLMFGRENALFKDYRGQNMLVDDNEFVEQIEDRVKHIHGLVDVLHPQLISELNERRAHADIVLARTPGVPVGTLVQLRRMTKSDKLTRRYQGLYKIVSRTSEGNYALESIRGRPLPTPVHPTRIRVITPAIANDLLTHPEGRDENEDDDSENTFEVEEIRNHRQRRVGRNVVLEYEIKWVGFPETTWEAETNVYADELVAKYWDKLHAETHVNFIEEIREQQLLDKLSDALRYYPSAALQKWICYQTGMLELDVSPSTHVLSFCTARLNKPLDHNDQLFLKSKSIWLDLQWSLEPLFISWICNHCRGKTIHSLLPEWLSLPKGCLLLNTLQLPSNIVWFTHADGTPSTRIPTPSWHCSLISFVVM